MLKPKPLIAILDQVNTGGVTATLLFTKDGQLLAVAGQTDEQIAAIASGIWTSFNNYGSTVLSSTKLNHVYLECKSGKAIVQLVGEVLLCLYSNNPNINSGLLRLKTKTIAEHLEKPLTKLMLN